MSSHRTKTLQLAAFAAAALAAWAFYSALEPVFGRGAIYDFFASRGKYQHASVYFFFAGLMLLIVRWWTFRPEPRSLSMPLPAGNVAPEMASRMIEAIPARFQDTILGRRVANLVKGFNRGEDLGPLEDRLAENDRASVEASASLVSWVRGLPPIIGLLGTLHGLRGGIAEIATLSGGQDINQLRAGLQNFAGNSSTAFDTTLLGIVAALILSAGLFFLRENEDSHLARVDAIAGDLARRFQRLSPEEDRFQRISDAMLETFRERLSTMLEHSAQNLDATLLKRAEAFDAAMVASGKAMIERVSQEIAARIDNVSGGFVGVWQETLRQATQEIFSQIDKRSDFALSEQARIEASVTQGLESVERSLMGIYEHVSRPLPLRIHVSSEPELNNHHAAKTYRES